jgi:hypothetical protein
LRIETREFADVAVAAAEVVRGQDAFASKGESPVYVQR